MPLSRSSSECAVEFRRRRITRLLPWQFPETRAKPSVPGNHSSTAGFRRAYRDRRRAPIREGQRRARKLPGYGGECFGISSRGPRLPFEKLEESACAEIDVSQKIHRNDAVRVAFVQFLPVRNQ